MEQYIGKICSKEEVLLIKAETCDKEEHLQAKTEICVKEEPLLPEVEYEEEQIQQKLSKQEDEKFRNLKEEVLFPKKLKLNELGEREKKTFFKVLEESKYPLVIVRKLREDIVKDLLVHNGSVKKDESFPRKGEKSKVKTFKADVRKDGSKKFKCPSCEVSFDKNYHLRSHIMSRHSKNKLYQCSRCTFDSNEVNKFNEHIIIHGKIKLYRCLKCDYESDFKDKIKSHELKYCSKIFTQPQCDSVCKFKDKLQSHVLDRDQRKLYKCSHCDGRFIFASYLRLHELNVHANERLLKCSDCSFETIDKAQFKMHLLEHSNEKSFTCSECSYTCNYRPSFYIHMLAHRKKELSKTCEGQEQNSSFKMSNGKKEFYRKRKRPLLNSSFVMFACPECDYNSKYKSHLMAHLRAYHCTTYNKLRNPLKCETLVPVSSFKMFACSECDYNSKCKTDLMAHLKEDHFMAFNEHIALNIKKKRKFSSLITSYITP